MKPQHPESHRHTRLKEVTGWDAGALSDAQVSRVSGWLRSPRVIRDMSWGLVDTTVLHVSDGDTQLVVKASGPLNHHIGREITAHESHTGALTATGAAGRMIAADRDLNMLMLEYLDGSLVEGTEHEHDPDTHTQAGRLLRTFHTGSSRTDDEYENRATRRSLVWLDAEHHIDPATEDAVRAILSRHRPRPVTVVATHGDWQPRNWLIEGTRVKVIDFGRFDFRPAHTDLCRLAVQQWRDDESLVSAFIEGYGSDPRESDLWPMALLREAIGTAVWAHQVGDHAFEAQGHRMLREALTLF